MQRSNDRLYDVAGLGTAHRALRPGGLLGVWSESPDRKFKSRLQRGGFTVEEHKVRSAGSGGRHVVWIGEKVGGAAAAPGRRDPKVVEDDLWFRSRLVVKLPAGVETSRWVKRPGASASEAVGLGGNAVPRSDGRRRGPGGCRAIDRFASPPTACDLGGEGRRAAPDSSLT